MHRQYLSLSVAVVCLLFLAPVASATTLSYWLWDQDQVPATQQIIDAFTAKNPGISVEISVFPFSEYWTKLPVALAGGAGPDVFWTNVSNFAVLRKTGALLDLDSEIKRDPEFQRSVNAIAKALVDAYTWDGKLYGIPRDVDSIAMLYSANHVEDAGLVAPRLIEDEWDWNTLLTYARRLTRKQDDQVTRWGYRLDSWGQGIWYNFIYSNGGRLFSSDGTRATFAMPENVAAIEWLSALRHQYEVAGPGVFREGTASMESYGNWILKNYIESLPFDWEVAQFPLCHLTGKRGVNIHGLSNAINTHSSKRDAAVTFVKYLSTRDAASILAKTRTVIPARTDTANMYFEGMQKPANATAFVKAVSYGVMSPVTPYLAASDWSTPVNDAVTAALNGTKPALAALSDAENVVNSRLREALQK